MGAFISALGAQAASSAVGQILGMPLAAWNDRRQLRQQGRLSEQQMGFDKRMTDYNQQKQLEMWEKTGPQGQMEQLKKAGLNPGLIYGMGGAGGQTANVTPGNVQGAKAPAGGGEVEAMTGMGIQSRLLKAQEELLQSQANLNNVEAAKKSGVDTENTKADTANKIAQNLIYEYAGKEAQSYFENVAEPNRINQDLRVEWENKAAWVLAEQMVDWWQDGTLNNIKAAELEKLLLENEKTKANTRQIYKSIDMLEANLKGKNLENIMLDMDVELQKSTGLGKDSPALLKALARFLQTMISKYY